MFAPPQEPCGWRAAPSTGGPGGQEGGPGAPGSGPGHVLVSETVLRLLGLLLPPCLALLRRTGADAGVVRGAVAVGLHAVAQAGVGDQEEEAGVGLEPVNWRKSWPDPGVTYALLEPVGSVAGKSLPAQVLSVVAPSPSSTSRRTLHTVLRLSPARWQFTGSGRCRASPSPAECLAGREGAGLTASRPSWPRQEVLGCSAGAWP